jgi:hypothetical protein
LRISTARVDQYRANSNSDRVIDLTEQLKPPADQGHRMSLAREQPQSSTTAPPMDDAEQAMRRALGLYGDQPRPRPDTDRAEPAQRSGGGFMPGGGFTQGVHRRRFVQDGEVPVTVVHPGGGQAGPTSSRLQRVEAALAVETAARDRAERALHEAQAAVQALQTKMGHNDLAKDEAVAAAKRLQDELVSLREELSAGAEQLKEAEARAHDAEDEPRTLRAELAEERRARKLAERLLREASDEPALMALDAAPEPASVHTHRPGATVERIPARRGRPPAVRAEPEVEPEPVKWWLLPAKTTAKRRQ